MDRTNKKEKWTLMKYVKGFEKLTDYADVLRSLRGKVDNESVAYLNDIMSELQIYCPRFGKPSVDTTQFKICQLVYYMFAYRSSSAKQELVFSPLGNLLLDNVNNREKVAKIFATMMFNMPFNHPYNKMSAEFNLYPFRLLFKLLCDSRLGGRLYCDEVFYHIVWTKEIDASSYEELVRNILDLRSTSNNVKYQMFRESLPLEDTLANALHETIYLFGHLSESGIVNHTDVPRDDYIGPLHHGGFGRGEIPYYVEPEVLARIKRSVRNYRMNYISLRPEMKEFILTMLNSYSYSDKPHDLLEQYGQQDYILRLYNFYPTELLLAIGLQTEGRISTILKLTNNIRRLSRNQQQGDSYRFEDILCEAFNEFEDVAAEKIAKSGTTDIECIYLTIDEKFDLEAKSTGTKLTSISAGRLLAHRRLIGSKYTIIVAPYFSPSVLEDIQESDNVIMSAASLCNFLYQSAIYNKGELTYEPLYNIVQNGLGTNISPVVNDFVASNYGIGRSN